VVRIDTETGHTDAHDFGEGRYLLEPIFAPAAGSAAGA
jgi:carotenoid cleavage dioxygenase-like enzyme